jgi:hypothetical protein
MRGIFLITTNRLASQEGLCSMEYVLYDYLFSTPPKVYSGSGDHPPYKARVGRVSSGRDLKLPTYLHLVLRLKINETIALLPLHTFISLPGNFYLTSSW